MTMNLAESGKLLIIHRGVRSSFDDNLPPTASPLSLSQRLLLDDKSRSTTPLTEKC